MKYTVNTDLTGDMSLADVSTYLSKYNGQLESLKRDDNGNFDTKISFPEYEQAFDFLVMHEQVERADSSAVLHGRVTVDFGPGAFSMDEWKPVIPVDVLKTIVDIMGSGGYVKVVSDGEKVVFLTEMKYDGIAADSAEGPFGVVFEVKDKVMAFEPIDGHPAY